MTQPTLANELVVEGAAIDREKNRLSQVETELSILNAQVESAKGEINSIEQRLRFGQAVDRFYYESLVDRHNTMVRDYNFRATMYKSAVQAVNRRVEAYNAKL